MQVSAQLKWDGGGGDNQWSNRFNWNTDILPVSDTEVLLDHTYIKEQYEVVLPSGNIPVTIKNIRIDAGEDSIILILPSSNVAVPALMLSGRGYSLYIGDKGIFINASGAASGQPVQVSDSIRIDNGGKIIHRTSRSHAANVTVLSIAPGTERGIFQFDIPNASATISLSDRKFGSLRLSAHSAPGKINYTASGTRSIHVRGDFIIDTAVTLSLNFSDTFSIYGNFIQNGGTLNCAAGSRPLTLAVKGNFFQHRSGILTESGTVVPTILLNGNGIQTINAQGVIMNSILVAVKNAGCRLASPLSLPYKLKLITGIMQTADSALLILLPGSEIISDSTIHTSFIEGPIQKMGIDNSNGFLFPVGQSNTQRWMRIKGYSGNLTVEFVKENPQKLSNINGTGLHHISSLEYWEVKGYPMSNCRIELSFDNVNSGGVTELSSLRVAQIAEGRWVDAGNSATTGNAGSSGSVVSDLLIEHEDETRYFTLAAASVQNPLPNRTFYLSGEVVNNTHMLEWIYDGDMQPLYFIVESSRDNFMSHSDQIVEYIGNQKKYNYKNPVQDRTNVYYRIRAKLGAGQSVYSGIIHLKIKSNFFRLRNITGLPGSGIFLDITSSGKDEFHLQLTDNSGRVLERRRVAVTEGLNVIRFDMVSYPGGIYYLTVYNNRQKKVFPILR